MRIVLGECALLNALNFDTFSRSTQSRGLLLAEDWLQLRTRLRSSWNRTAGGASDHRERA